MTNITIDTTTFPLPSKHYYTDVYDKKFIVLHLTVGRSVYSAWNWWQRRNAGQGTVSTAFIVGREKERPAQQSLTCQLFDPKYWAYHLACGDRWYDQHSIGIEIANVGPLKKKGEWLYWVGSGDWSPRYCRVSDEADYIHAPLQCGSELYEYWATLSPEQEDSVALLCEYLCERYGISKTLIDDPNKTLDDISLLQDGRSLIIGHRTVRNDKSDPGMAVPYDKIRKVLRGKPEEPVSEKITQGKLDNNVISITNKLNNKSGNNLTRVRGGNDKSEGVLSLLLVFIRNLFS